ncbi:PadR family transcriptional regulator [Parvibacter caecicola]|nr:PadR family transcriptional regulator [Parvibacter caecicola]
MMDTQMKRGFLDACVLAAMAQGESYGYQIIKDVPASIGISESTLYPLLKRLESRKLIKVRKAEHNGRLRKYYSLTEAGRAFLAEFANDKKEIDEVFDFVERATRGA